jgi:subtilisin family serine protease
MRDQLREYVVCVHVGVNADEFWHHMEHVCENHPHVPVRCVHVINERAPSKRICHYALTDAEAEQLRQDPRVRGVELVAHAQPHMKIQPDAVQHMQYEKSAVATGNRANWGLKRCVSVTNNYGVSNQAPGGFPYTLDGTGVDVVIVDSGIQPDHPEFQDVHGVSRVQQIDWYLVTGITGSQSPNFYRDWDGHGTHVAAICAGKTYGWAKNARIYAIKLAGLEGAADEGTGMDVSDCMDVLLSWHQNKPLDPSTGHPRPTVVNMSWGYVSQFINIQGGFYRGTPWTGTTRRTDYGMVGDAAQYFGVRDLATDVAVEELTQAGVHVCISAGNYFQKTDVPGGIDYNNYYTRTGVGNVFYHRGSSPAAPDAIRVGSTDVTVRDENTEYKSVFSDAGAAVDVWAPGSFILSACSNITQYEGVSASYYAHSSYKQAVISGTSMSAPQVAGVVSLYLQLNPWSTPTQVKSWLASHAQNVIYETGSDSDYTNNRSLWGASNRFLYVPFNSPYPLESTGTVGIQALQV